MDINISYVLENETLYDFVFCFENLGHVLEITTRFLLVYNIRTLHPRSQLSKPDPETDPRGEETLLEEEDTLIFEPLSHPSKEIKTPEKV